MTVLRAYTGGFKESVRLYKPMFIIWIFNLLLAALVAMPFYNAVDSQIGHSLAAEKLIEGFSASIWADMIDELKSSAFLLLSQVKWLFFIYLLLNIFFAGGIIQTLNQDKFSTASFFAGSAHNFFRYLGISLTMFVIQVIAALILWTITALFIFGNSESGTPETVYLNIFISALIVQIIVSMLLFMVSDYAKFHSSLYNKRNFFNSVGNGFRYVFTNFWKTTSLYFMLTLLPFAIVIAYFYIDIQINTKLTGGVIFLCIIQQIFILSRIWFRIWIFASPLQLYTDDFLHDNKVLKSLALMNEWQRKAKGKTVSIDTDLEDEQDNSENEQPNLSILTEAQILERIANEELIAQNTLDEIVIAEQTLPENFESVSEKNTDISESSIQSDPDKNFEMNQVFMNTNVDIIAENESITDKSNTSEKNEKTTIPSKVPDTNSVSKSEILSQINSIDNKLQKRFPSKVMFPDTITDAEQPIIKEISNPNFNHISNDINENPDIAEG